jgi:hypothetical protein
MLFAKWERLVYLNILVRWGVTLCNLIARYQCCGGDCCLHLTDRSSVLKMEAAAFSKTLVYVKSYGVCHIPKVPDLTM